jgi:hypothetical protein
MSGTLLAAIATFTYHALYRLALIYETFSRYCLHQIGGFEYNHLSNYLYNEPTILHADFERVGNLIVWRVCGAHVNYEFIRVLFENFMAGVIFALVVPVFFGLDGRLLL